MKTVNRKSEDDKFNEFAKKILVENPDCKTTLKIIELLCKHGVAKAIFKQTKSAYVTGYDEVEIQCGETLQDIQVFVALLKGPK